MELTGHLASSHVPGWGARPRTSARLAPLREVFSHGTHGDGTRRRRRAGEKAGLGAQGEPRGALLHIRWRRERTRAAESCGNQVSASANHLSYVRSTPWAHMAERQSILTNLQESQNLAAK